MVTTAVMDEAVEEDGESTEEDGESTEEDGASTSSEASCGDPLWLADDSAEAKKAYDEHPAVRLVRGLGSASAADASAADADAADASAPAAAADASELAPWVPRPPSELAPLAELIRLVRDTGCINARVDGITALIAAVRSGDLQAARILLEHGASANVPDEGVHMESSPLIHAVRRAGELSDDDLNGPSVAMIELLIEHRARLKYTNCDGCMAIAVAREHDLWDITDMLVALMKSRHGWSDDDIMMVI